ncbi:MAG TPA: acetate/propionate family kinase [Candidatus Saccharimonadales bacterium]|nr:acetate/propionate family kinase [Candidatus Saccharimonadales bacterium]
MKDAILVLNSGSSSVKFSVFVVERDALKMELRGQLESLLTSPRFVARNCAGKVIAEKSWGEGVKLGHEGALEHLRTFLLGLGNELRLSGVGHRVVHGGVKYARPVRITEQILADLDELIPLAPLHQPHNLQPIRAIADRMPEVPQVACFDTAFHRGNPPLAQMFALPKALTDAGVRRYGFHGISCEYIASVLPQFDPRAATGRTVVLHLGNGSSMCAMAGGKSVASTMGFTAMEGLPMGTRCGSLDPGVVLFLLQQRGMDARAVEKMLYHECGLLGVSGVSSDVRTLLESNEPGAKLALDLYVYRIGRELGSLAAALGGLDAVVFTAGIGENAVAIRERVCRDAAWLGVELDAVANANPDQSGCITTMRSRVSGWVIPTNEELMIARHTLRELGANHSNERAALCLTA